MDLKTFEDSYWIMGAKRVAIFVHGWAMDDRIYHRNWIRERGAPLFQLFRDEFGCDIVPLTMPGYYLNLDKDFDWYGEYTSIEIKKLSAYEEIFIIAHSMGAISVRVMLKKIFDEETESVKRRIEEVFLLGAPNHGTFQPVVDTLSTILTTIGHLIVPGNTFDLDKVKESFLNETPCYRDIHPGSTFLRELNSDIEFPIWTRVHNIWTMEDTIVQPAHSCLLPGASNYLITKRTVNHLNMLYRSETVSKVRSIMNGTARTTGPQTFPDGGRCKNGGDHEWIPDPIPPTKKVFVQYVCRACGMKENTTTLPAPLGCPEGIVPDGPHRWRRGAKMISLHYSCSKCGIKRWHPIIV